MTQPNRPRFRIAKRQYRDFKQSPLRHIRLMTANPLPITGLSQHDSFYKQMFENNRAVKLVIRQDNGQIVDANPAACQFYGYTFQQLTALHITDINILPRPEVETLMRRTVTEKGIIFQAQHRLASGAIRDVEVFSGLVHVDGTHYLNSIIQDITNRKQAEKALRESEALYRLFAQNMPDSSVVMFDTNMRHTLAEGPYLKTFGPIHKELVGKTPHEVFPKELADSIVPFYQRALQGESFNYERITENYAYESFITPVRDENGTIIGGLILSHDISKRHSAATALKDSETRHQSIISSMSEGIVVHAQNGSIQTCNAAAETILGLTADQLTGRTSFDPRWRAIHEDGSPFPGETHPAMLTLRTGQSLTNIIMGVHKPDGTLSWLSINSRPMLRPDETLPYAVVATFVDITERKRLEDELRTSKNMLTQVIENIPFRIFWKDQHSVYRGCNTRHAIGNGLASADEIIGKTDYDFLPERAAEWEADDQKIMASGQPKLNVEELIVDPDGSSRWLRSNKVPMRDANGATSGVLIALEDITERKRLEEALRTNEERLRLITDNITDMILQSDEIGRVVFVSPSFHTVLGYEPLAMLGASTTEYIHPDDLAQLGLAIQTAVETGRTQVTVEYRARHADGHFLNVETACNILKNDLSQYIGALFVTRDITERKRLEEALRTNEQRLRLITDHMLDLVTQNDEKGRMIYVSPSSQTMLGYTPESLLGTPSIGLIHPDDIAPMRKIFHASLAENPSQFRLEARLRHADGHYIPVETVGRIVTDDHANVISGVFISRDVTERKRLEEALRANEQRLRLITNNVQDIVTENDLGGLITYASPSMQTILGYSPDKVLGTSARTLIHPDDFEAMGVIFQKAFEDHEHTFYLDLRMRHADGHYIPIETNGTFVNDERGNIVSSVYVSRDITERKRLEEALRANEQRLRLITDNILDLVTHGDKNNHITYASPSISGMLGYDPQAVIGRNAADFIHHDDQIKYIQARQLAFESGMHNYIVEAHMLHADGTIIPVETKSTLLFDENQQFAGWVNVARDITERKRLEEALRANEQRLRLITDNMGDLVTLTDGKRRSVFVSPSFTTLLGYEMATLENATILDYIHPDDIERIVREVFTARTSGLSGFSTEFRLRHADGHYIEAETVGKFTYAPNGDFIGTVLITRDITERKRFQETLIQHEKLQATLEKEYELSALKSRMMERITHEFRTPLSIIQISAENLLYYYERLTPERREAKMTAIKSQVRRITDMLDEIALVVNGSFMPNKLNLRAVDLSLQCRSLAQELEKQSNTPGKYQLDLPDSINVQLDVPVFDNALLHIMRNAARFSDQLAPVIIKLSHTANTAELQVIDSGIGIPPHELPHVFEPFFRGSNINERGGIGVGLTIARAAIEAHGGTITIDSTLRQGTTVTIRLPA